MKNLFINKGNYPADEKTISRLILFLKEKFDKKIESLEVNFISPAEIKKLNRSFLKHDYVTDILTFSYSEDTSTIDAEMIICYDEAVKNASKFNSGVEEEVIRLVIHGFLHLIGFDDAHPNDRKVMSNTENELIKTFKFSLLKQN